MKRSLQKEKSVAENQKRQEDLLQRSAFRRKTALIAIICTLLLVPGCAEVGAQAARSEEEQPIRSLTRINVSGHQDAPPEIEFSPEGDYLFVWWADPPMKWAVFDALTGAEVADALDPELFMSGRLEAVAMPRG